MGAYILIDFSLFHLEFKVNLKAVATLAPKHILDEYVLQKKDASLLYWFASGGVVILSDSRA